MNAQIEICTIEEIFCCHSVDKVRERERERATHACLFVCGVLLLFNSSNGGCLCFRGLGKISGIVCFLVWVKKKKKGGSFGFFFFPLEFRGFYASVVEIDASVG